MRWRRVDIDADLKSITVPTCSRSSTVYGRVGLAGFTNFSDPLLIGKVPLRGILI